MLFNSNRVAFTTIAAAAALLMGGAVQAAEPFTIKDIRVEGLQRVEAGTVFGYLPVKVGETFDDQKSADAIRALFGTGFFKDVQLRNDGGVLVVLVEERPAIANVDFVGGKEFDKDLLRKSLKAVGVAEARFYDRAVIERAEQELKRQYIARGFYAAEVTTTVTPIERNRVTVVFNIEEGSVAKIRQINIVGNQKFSESDLRDEMQLRTPNWLSWYTKTDLYSKQKLTADLETLRSFYLNQGYLEFAVQSTQVTISPDKRDIYLTINISEGEQYKISNVRLAGELLGKRDEFEKLVAIKPGEIFSSAKMTAVSKALSDALGNYGYAFAQITPQPQIDRDKREVFVTLLVDPGKRIYVRRINVVGNTKTRDEVVRRELRQFESSWYDAGKVKLSQDRVNRTAYFTEVNISPDEVPGIPDQVDLNVNVTEKPTGQISVGAGYSTTEKIVLTAGISQDNIFGSGTSLSLNVNTSQLNRTLSIQQNDPYFTIDGVNRLTDVYYRTSRPLYYLGDSDFKIVTAGGSMRFGVPFSETDRVYFGLGYEHTALTLSSNTPLRYQRYAQDQGISTSNVPLTIGWSRDRRDSALVPADGQYQQANAEIGTPLAQLRYYRLYYQHQLFQPLWKGFTLALNGEIGYGRGYGDRKFPIFKNYYAGGIGSVRGYQTSTLGPFDYDQNGNRVPLGGSSKAIVNAEFIFPLPGAGLDRTFRLFTFFDAGNVYDGVIKPNDLRYSYGLGFSWISPIGPLKLSMGFPLRKRPEDRLQRLQFQIGTAF